MPPDLAFNTAMSFASNTNWQNCSGETTLSYLSQMAGLTFQNFVCQWLTAAHTNIPGSRNVKRCQDVHELLAAGIDVLSTLNIQHLESLNDVGERITGVKERETIPDDVVRVAEQVQLVDLTPEALRRRLEHGRVRPGQGQRGTVQLLPTGQPGRAP